MADDKTEFEKAGGTFSEETTDGVRRVTSSPDDPNPDKDAAKVGPAPIVNAPQNWDDVSATFSAGKLDPNAENADALNEAQSRATVGHAVAGPKGQEASKADSAAKAQADRKD